MERVIDAESTKMLQEDLGRELERSVEIEVYTDGQNEFSQFTMQFMRELSEISDKIKIMQKPRLVSPQNADPYLKIGANLGYQIAFNGTPAGHEATTILEVVKMVSKGKSGLSKSNEETLSLFDKELNVKVFVTPSCPHCPPSAILAAKMAIANPKQVVAEIVEAQENMELSQKFNVSSVPQQVFNDEVSSITIGTRQETEFIGMAIQYASSDPDKITQTIEANKQKSMELTDAPTGVITLTDGNFERALEKYPNLVVDFWATWCAPCRMIAPIIESLAEDMQGKAVFGKLNVDENPEIAQKYGVDTIPTLIYFQRGAKIHQSVGALPKNVLLDEVKKRFGL